MPNLQNKFTFKIILSYLVLGALAVLVGWFLYAEYKKYTDTASETLEDKKVIETGTLINLVYETDGLSRLALLSLTDEDFAVYKNRADSLFNKIEQIKLLTDNSVQKAQLDSVKQLLFQKHKNIEQLKILKLTNNKGSSLDDILIEIQDLESSLGKLTIDTFVENPSRLSPRERRLFQQTVEYLNQANAQEGMKKETVDSMLTASRYIVAEAKRENSETQRSLQQKENELILSDLTISQQLRKIITAFDAEIVKNNRISKANRAETIQNTKEILKIAGILAGLLVLLFSYFILSDFFRAERFKKSLEQSNKFTEDLLKSREQLIATVSHDLKTPINTIVGYSNLLENTSLNKKQHQYLERIRSGSTYVTRLVDDLLDLSRIDAGKIQLEEVPFSFENMIRQTAGSIQDMHADKPIELKIEMDKQLIDSVFISDPLRVQQIINNLIGNAFKFTEKGVISIRGKQIGMNKGVAHIQLSVQDTGIGISEEKQEAIFEEFTQAEVTTSQQFGGNGLGLAISKKLTNLLGGSLTVNSQLGHGSTFTAVLPFKIGKKLKHSAASKQNVTLEEPLAGLILDDDPAMTTLLEEIFDQMGIETYAYNKFSSILKDQPHGFDFVLTDIQMPGVDGFQFFQELQSGSIHGYSDQPVFAMTGSREHASEYYIKKGFEAVLPKPFDKERLLTVLQERFKSKLISFGDDDKRVKTENSAHYDLSLLYSFLEHQDKVYHVVSIFVTQTKEDLNTLNALIEQNNTIEVSNIAHRMATMFRQIQANHASALLEQLENFTSDNETDYTLRSVYRELKAEVQVVLKQLQEELDSP